MSYFLKVIQFSYIGTFITEWDDGAKICEEFLKNEESVCRLSMQLVHIAIHCKFDGWLINIENRLKVRIHKLFSTILKICFLLLSKQLTHKFKYYLVK